MFPAAILQPPFYDYKADAAVNYGGIGAVIGHEISHGFDDSGSRFDAQGNLNNWWTEKDLEQFESLGGALADQYSSIEVLDSVYINGEFTLGENIGDLGGVNAAYDGLQLHLEANGHPGEIDGFTPEQRFFMSWATVWRTKMRNEALKNKIKTDPHSPGCIVLSSHFKTLMPSMKLSISQKEMKCMYVRKTELSSGKSCILYYDQSPCRGFFYVIHSFCISPWSNSECLSPDTGPKPVSQHLLQL